MLDDANRIRFANARARLHLGLDPERDLNQAFGNLVRQPEVIRYLEAGDFSDPVTVPSEREPGRDAVDPGRALRRRAEAPAVTRHHADRGDRAHAPRIHRQRFARAQDAPHRRRRFRRDACRTSTSTNGSAVAISGSCRNRRATCSGWSTTCSRFPRSKASRTRRSTRRSRWVRSSPRSARRRARCRPAATRSSRSCPQIRKRSSTGARDELASAFGNLVSNAVRYTPDGGTITLSWQIDSEGRGRFAVADSGVGIAPEHLPRLTERFYRVDRSRSRATGGTGLGLAIVNHVLLRHQAALEIESEPGKGSTFAAILPASRVTRIAGTDVAARDTATVTSS